MAVDDLLRVACQAHRDGRRPLREAMLTLAIGASDPGDAWAERCRARLLAERPGHFFGSHSTLQGALADPRVVNALNKLRGQFPPGRVSWLRFRAEVESGPYLGEHAPLSKVLDVLLGPPAEAEVRRDAPERVRGPRAPARSRVLAAQAAFEWAEAAEGGTDELPVADGSRFDPAEPETEDSIAGFYMAVLLSIALLMATVERERDHDRRAA
jgi:hypothetical protein